MMMRAVRVAARSFHTSSALLAARVRAPAPAFKAGAVVDGHFKDVSLADYKGKWVVLFFYPLDFTFVCPTEITAFSDRIAEFKAVNTEVLGVSIDSKFSHLQWINTPRNKGGLGKLEYPLVADVPKSICRDYGVLVEDPSDDLNGIALRGTFIIDPKGIVRNLQITDEAVGRSVDEVLRLIQAFQHAEKHGSVCPSDWKPGKKTMTPDPIKSQEYFSQLK